MKIINNQDIRLIDELKTALDTNSEIYLCGNYLSPQALHELSNEISNCKAFKILLDDNDGLDTRFAYDYAEAERYLDLKGRFKSITAHKIISEKSQIRAGSTGGQKFIIVKKDDRISIYFLAPNDLNLVSLGVLRSKTPIVISAHNDQQGQFDSVFQSFWNNASRDAKSSVLNLLERGTQPIAPDRLYKLNLHHIFHKKQGEDFSTNRINRIGFKNTQIWQMLFNFQQDAVMGAIDKIENYNGCIIADSVGLGKTFEALAVMKYYQMRNDRILVLCPKKLRDNWTVYAQNDIRNILAKDRFNFDVLNHTDMSRSKGLSGDINLETLNWGNYDLVVIDESHNFRNNNPRKDAISRYQRLMNDIILSGVKTKVLMLSATPVNTRMNDIKNQIAFITEQNDEAFSDQGITSIESTLRIAQQRFNLWLKESGGSETKRSELINSLDGSFFKLLDLITIARSRKHIQKYYDLEEIGKFPDRLKPISIYSKFDTSDKFPKIDVVNNELNALNLKFYSPLSYVRDDKRAAYEAKYDIVTRTGSVFKQVQNEETLIHLMRVNLLKRLESSIHSFRLTLEMLLKQIDQLLEKVLSAQQNAYYDDDLDINKLDLDDDLLEDLIVGGKTKVLLQDIDLIKCKEELLDDKERIEHVLGLARMIDPSRDAKLKDLRELIANKISNPINQGNQKMVIFSAFSDTVNYLYNNLKDWLRNDLGLYAALVTGSGDNKTTMPKVKAEYSTILTHFSPISKQREMIYPDTSKEIDILFCTDCISEGQNLQDCDYLVNYDIHWNPVRIIQRFGRIDRIGSKNDSIQLVNFFPNLDLDSYIDLIGRVRGRMQILDVSATGDDNIIDESGINKSELEYRKKQLQQLQNKVLDLEDIEGGISITDLNYNDFRVEAERFTDQEKQEFELTPKGLYSVVKSNIPESQQGVIFCFKDLSGEDNHHGNAIHPYSLCYMNMQGEILVPVINSRLCLDYYKKLCSDTKHNPYELIEQFDKEVQYGKNMGKYQQLLRSALQYLKGAEEEVALDSLAKRGGTKYAQNIMDAGFELISFLIVK